MNSCNRIVFALGIAVVGVWFARRRLRFDAPLSAREWHEDAIGRDDLAG
ncbi:hypothetical protein M2284_001012 [Rhodococcus sp. LBL1]|uniref:Uncharacterized protein n=1 Tax=Prescottella agglutinans TaxID=1644129 RepID=A0ABT6MHP7_9NOCA|nr:hypothetical protein [Prescottella agglutinans]MDH6283849.1 hypothetical protein [Prescottella agglutinans]MDH6676814.1 hypothetical protein [Rhodococcus sp. LBL1]MDH6682893.1 hypothetical protein [Rhodococcus sp. LBL2]